MWGRGGWKVDGNTLTNKGRLIKYLKAQRVLFEVVLEPISPADMLRPGVMGDLSVKDLIAHVTVWDVRGTGWIVSAAEGRQPDFPDWTKLDELNHQTYLEHRDRPLEAVMNDFAAAWPPLLAATEALPEAALGRSIRLFNGHEWQDMPVGRLVRWRYRHYNTHGGQIREWYQRELEGKQGN